MLTSIATLLIALAAGIASFQTAAFPSPPPAFFSPLASAWGLLVGAFAFYGALSLLTYLLPVAWANARGVQDLRAKYDAQWAVVTGASSGIGKALAHALAAQGINVVLVALDDMLLISSGAELRNEFPERQFREVGVDLTLPGGEYMGPIAKATADIHVSLLFNNAGYIVTKFYHDAPVEVHLKNMQCNSVSAVRITHHFLQKMYASRRCGLVVFTSSAAAYLPSPFTAFYSATKSFLSRFATSLAAEAQPQGVDVLAVHPSPVHSNFTKNATKIKVMDDFYKFATGPEVVPAQIFRKVGRAQVLGELGATAVLLRLVTKMLDDCFFASAFAAFAGLLPDYKEHAAKSGLTAHTAGNKRAPSTS